MRKTKIAFSFLILATLAVPAIFTLFELGTFSPNPKVDIQPKFTGNDVLPLRVVADFDFSPYSFYDENNNEKGLDVELINEIANRLGMKPEIKFTTWQECKKDLNAGKADLILGLEIFSHMTGVLKTVPASEDKLVIFGKTKIHDVAALKGKKVALMVNSIITRIFELNCNFVEYFTNSDILAAIEKGEVDYGICHNSVARKIIEKEGYRIFPSVSIMNSYPAIGVRDDVPELKDKINNILSELSSEGFIKKLDEKWLIKFTSSPDLDQIYSENGAFYNTFAALFILVISSFILIILHDRNKRKAFEKSTALQKEVTKQFDLLTSLSGIYVSVHVINLVEDTYTEMSATDSIKKYMSGSNSAKEQMDSVVRNSIIPEDLDAALMFINLSTISERIGERDVLMANFRTIQTGWICCQFIVVERDAEGNVTEVVFTIQDINESMLEKEKLITISTIDELTKVYNRYSFETKYQEILNKDLSELTIIELDVNGLKPTNDNIGHAAGDELICGSAECIVRVFGTMGFIYRTGGDEFTVIIEKNTDNQEEIIERFKNTVAAWRGVLVKNASVSIGIASASEIQDFTPSKFQELMQMADKRMYADKSSFYKMSGTDRRKN